MHNPDGLPSRFQGLKHGENQLRRRTFSLRKVDAIFSWELGIVNEPRALPRGDHTIPREFRALSSETSAQASARWCARCAHGFESVRVGG